MKLCLVACVLVLCLTGSYADLYMHNPRGSNNRHSGENANANNQNRLFDSQNNAKGGYNVGENSPNGQKVNFNDGEGVIGRLTHYEKSYLEVEWTNQHGCGAGHPNMVCELVFQYQCGEQLTDGKQDGNKQNVNDAHNADNGVHETEAYYKKCRKRERNKGLFVADQNLKGHTAVYTRQDANGNRYGNECPEERDYYPYWHPTPWRDIAVMPSTSIEKRCEYYKTESQNVKAKGYCDIGTADLDLVPNNKQACEPGGLCGQFYNQKNNFNGNADVTKFVGNVDFQFNNAPTSGINQNNWSVKFTGFVESPLTGNVTFFTENDDGAILTVNNVEIIRDISDHAPRFHSGVAANLVKGQKYPIDLRHYDGGGPATIRLYWSAGGQDEATIVPLEALSTDQTSPCVTAAGFEWKEEPAHGVAAPECIPSPMSRSNHLGNGEDGLANHYTWQLPTVEEACGAGKTSCKCVFRMRYNMSSADIGWEFDSALNGDNSPIRNNPTIDVGIGEGITLAHNTDQVGRTFQDRSHVFTLQKRPDGVNLNTKIYNLNVRGKRGNIVQTFPAVEYDFVPNHLEINRGDLVHIAWTGSNRNPAGNDGQGKAQTDRSNIVQLADIDDNYPLDISKHSLFTDVNGKASWSTAIKFATVGRCDDPRTCVFETPNPKNRQADDNSALLNNANPTYDGGLVSWKTAGTYNYMCTRNNNFTNRSQKARITVK